MKSDVSVMKSMHQHDGIVYMAHICTETQAEIIYLQSATQNAHGNKSD